MSLRGPTLLLFGASLVLSPLAINLASGKGTGGGITTVGAAEAACERASVELVGGQRIGCARDAGRREAARQMPGGASFVVARR